MQLTTITWSRSDGWSRDLAGLDALDSPRTLALAFGDRELDTDPRPLHDLSRALGRSHVVGCSSSGTFCGPELDRADLVVALARFERTVVTTASVPVTDAAASLAAGRALAADLHRPDLRAAFVLSDGLGVNGSDLVRGLRSGLPPEAIVTGGLAGDAARFERTWTYAGGKLSDRRVVAVGLTGPTLEVGYGSAGGWGIFGPERRVTRSEGNVLHELDGRPALALYRHYLGELAEGLPATALRFPLAVREDGESEATVRTVLAVDDDAQTMTFAGDIPQGWRAQLMRSSVDRLVDGAATAGGMCRTRAAADARGGGAAAEAGNDTLGVAVSCVGRRLVLGERTEEEIEATLRALGSETTLVGFYSYGEIAPDASGYCDLHNQTMTVVTYRER